MRQSRERALRQRGPRDADLRGSSRMMRPAARRSRGLRLRRGRSAQRGTARDGPLSGFQIRVNLRRSASRPETTAAA